MILWAGPRGRARLADLRGCLSPNPPPSPRPHTVPHETTGSKEHRQTLHPPQAWEAAIADYLAGATAWAIQERYGIREGTFRKRLSREGIAKSRQPYELPPSLSGERADDAAARAAAAGASSAEDAGEAPSWAEIAHPAQLAPPGAWSTWLFQGGRGAGKTRAGTAANAATWRPPSWTG